MKELRPYELVCIDRLKEIILTYKSDRSFFDKQIRDLLIKENPSNEYIVESKIRFYNFSYVFELADQLQGEKFVFDFRHKKESFSYEDTKGLKLDAMDVILQQTYDSCSYNGAYSQLIGKKELYIQEIPDLSKVKICAMCGNSAKCRFLCEALNLTFKE